MGRCIDATKGKVTKGRPQPDPSQRPHSKHRIASCSHCVCVPNRGMGYGYWGNILVWMTVTGPLRNLHVHRWEHLHTSSMVADLHRRRVFVSYTPTRKLINKHNVTLTDNSHTVCSSVQFSPSIGSPGGHERDSAEILFRSFLRDCNRVCTSIDTS